LTHRRQRARGYCPLSLRPGFFQRAHQGVEVSALLRVACWRIRGGRGCALADAPPKLVMLALSDLLQEHLTRLVMLAYDCMASASAEQRYMITSLGNYYD
jgi:hypothetical protein